MGNVREDKNEHRRSTFGFNIEKNNSIYFAKIELFFIFETKSSLFTSVSISYTIFQILKTKFDVL